jgi:hypothetical protein
MEALTAVEGHIVCFWVMISCSLVDEYQRFGGTYCLHLQGWFLLWWRQWHELNNVECAIKNFRYYWPSCLMFDVIFFSLPIWMLNQPPFLPKASLYNSVLIVDISCHFTFNSGVTQWRQTALTTYIICSLQVKCMKHTWSSVSYWLKLT